MQEAVESVRGMSTVVREYICLARTCRELYSQVMTEALPALAQEMPAPDLAALRLEDVSEYVLRFLRDPKSCGLAELQARPFLRRTGECTR